MVINAHDITLSCGSGRHNIMLIPLNDAHLPLLYRWNSDPEVLHWSDDQDVTRYTHAEVREIYHHASLHALCFLILADEMPVGECWLQPMNVSRVRAQYPGQDVRRIDILIGEKAYWGQGIGSRVIGKLVDFAFVWQRVDVLHCFVADYNTRSQRAFARNGFQLTLIEPIPNSCKAKAGYHYVLRRSQYPPRVPAIGPIWWQSIDSLQPSQLYISQAKLQAVWDWYRTPSAMDPLPVIAYGDGYLLTDGHTRACAAIISGHDRLPVYLDTDTLDMTAYDACAGWCRRDNVGLRDLPRRVIPPQEYEIRWLLRCAAL